MSKCDYAGIDYGRGMSNVDGSTGIRYGVIHQGEVLQVWADESEANYGDPRCPKCGGEVVDLVGLGNEEIELRDDDDRLITADEIDDWEFAEHECAEYACIQCKYVFGSESAMPEEPYSFSYDQDGYACEQGHDDWDIFILKSPYYTWCQFCSPCAPGAGYTMNWMEPGEGIKAYCFGHDWFPEIETGKRVKCTHCHGTNMRPQPLTMSPQEAARRRLVSDYVECWVCDHGWIKETVQKAPYPVYRVDTDELVEV